MSALQPVALPETFNIFEIKKICYSAILKFGLKIKDNNPLYKGLAVQCTSDNDDSHHRIFGSVDEFKTETEKLKKYLQYNEIGRLLLPHLQPLLKLGLSRGRILCLNPGGELKTHIDADGLTRLHIVLNSKPGSLFTVGGVAQELSEGHAYLLDTGFPHSVVNHSNEDRIHLVFDVLGYANLSTNDVAGKLTVAELD